MATILTSTQTAALVQPGQSKIDRSVSTGALLSVVRETGGNLAFWVSTDNGGSWSDLNIDINRGGLQEWSGVYIDGDGWLHIAYRVYESGQDRVFYRRASTAAGWSSEIQVASANSASAGLVYGGVDLVAVRSGAGSSRWYVHMAVGVISGGSIGAALVCVRWSYVSTFPFWWVYDWEAEVTTGVYSGNRQWLASGSGHTVPSIDLRHNGDAHTSSAPDLWVTWGRTNVYVTRLSYSGGTSEKWSGGSAVQIGTRSVAIDYAPGRWDGTRWLGAVHSGSQATLVERDAANINTTLRTPPVHPTGVIRHIAVTYDPSSGAARIYAVGTSTAVLYEVDYVRATGLWGAWTSTGITLAQVDNWSLRRGAFGNARYDVLTATGSTPFTYAHVGQVIPYAPSAPILNSLDVADVADTLAFVWTFSDIDPADTQSQWALQRQIGAGAAQWWRVSDSTWQGSETANTGGTTSVTLPAAWGSTSDALHSYRVKTWDSTGLPSTYSAAKTVIASSRINPNITAPTGTVIANSATAVWSVAQQTQSRVKLLNGAGTSTLHDSGWRAGTSPTYVIPYVLADGISYRVTVQTRNNVGLDSLIDSETITVDYVEPPTPAVVVSAYDDLGLIRVEIINPAPIGLQPNLSHQDIYRRQVGETGPGVRIARDLPFSN
jgi:hypothetical protein